MAIVNKRTNGSSAPAKEVTPSYITEAIESAKELASVIEESVEAIVDIAGGGDPRARKSILDGMCNNAVYQMPWRKKDDDEAQHNRQRLSLEVEEGDDGKEFALERAQDKESNTSWTYHHFKAYHDIVLASYKAETGMDYQPKKQGGGNSNDRRASANKHRK